MQKDHSGAHTNQSDPPECDPPERDASKRTVDERVIPVVEEVLSTHVRPVETGEVHVHAALEQTIEPVEAALTETAVSIRRVPVGRVVDGPLPVRTEDGATVVPVVEERLVVSTEWVLVEEVHIQHERRTRSERREVPVRKTQVRVERRGLEYTDAPDDSDDQV